MEVGAGKETAGEKTRQICTFRISGLRFAVDILDVKGISSVGGFTPIFHAPEEVQGYVNIRGEIYLIINMRSILRLDTKETDEFSRIILFKSEIGEPFGILVDRIDDIVTVDERQIEERRKLDQGLPEGVEGDRRMFDLGSGVCKLDDRLVVIMDSRNLLNIIGNLKAYWEESPGLEVTS
jgi:chemotaxis signal transduction protein